MEHEVQISREEQILFERAAAETWLRIRHDQAKSSPRVKDMLSRLGEDLYDSTLDVTRWKSSCNIRGNSIEQRFQQDLGCSPYQYLSSVRLETAARLLLEPRPKVFEIAALVGYKSLTVFSRAFRRQMGMRPTRYRALMGSSAPSQGRRARLAPWRQALLASADSWSSGDSLRRFTDYYPPKGTPSVEVPPQWSRGSERFERRRSERIWAGIRDRSSLEKILIVRLEADFETTALFDLLREKSREEGRRDRRRGLEIAELALLSLELCAEALGDDLPNREAQGWISVANARRLMLDFIGSDRDFEIAAASWREARKPDPLVEAELTFYKAALRWFQLSFKKGLELVNRAVEISRQLDHSTLLARSLILRSCINKNLKKIAQTIPDIQKALQLIDMKADPYMAVTAYTSLTTSLLELGHQHSAAAALRKAKEHSVYVDYKFGELKIRWLDGLLQQARGQLRIAEGSFKQALRGCVDLGEDEHAAVISLDIAVLALKRGEVEEAFAFAARAFPVLEAIKFDRDALAMLSLLRDALATKALTPKVLKTVRTFIESLLQNPLVRRARQRRASTICPSRAAPPTGSTS